MLRAEPGARLVNWPIDRLTLERRQVWVYAGAIVAGLVLGSAVPGLGSVAELLLWPVLAALLYATFVQVPLLQVSRAFRDARFTGAALLGNFVILPLFVWGAVSFLPTDPAIQLGVLMVLLVPCTDWFISFTQIAGGDVARAIAVTPVNLVLQILLLPLYLLLMARAEIPALVSAEVIAPAALIVIFPLLAAALTEKWVAARPSRQAVPDGLAWAPIPLLACVVGMIATAQVETVRSSLGVLPVVVPVFLAFLLAAAVTAKVLACALALPAAEGRTLAFGLATRNSFVVLPLALALPQGLEVAAVVIVVQSVVELLGMIFFVWWIPRLFRASPITA